MKSGKNYIILSKKERWGLTIWGWVLIVCFLFLMIFLGIRNLYGILAPNHREDANILVVEGFISDYVLWDAMKEFRNNDYELLITTGTPLEYGELLSPFKNTARIAGMSLLKLGFDSTKLVIVGTDSIRNDRTYNSAIALRLWLKKNKPGIKAINLMTMSVHGARSQRLFQYAFGDTIRVGIISVKNFYYGHRDWYKSSKGFRETLNEAIGYFYIRYFFRPY
ncbi:MAG: hypothetical protein PHF97_04920 [Bacteroidales bacterium]|nr:hypothetical protein [Bacteroidales bacterium]MDD4603127.1 hypothetical protein [Bacteroidales bacterium]